LAIKELEFDRATGKVSDEDYESMRQRFVDEAVEALRESAVDPVPDEAERLVAARKAALDGAPVARCPSCGPRPEADALFCSDCGRRVAGGGFCASCGGALPVSGRFCPECGAPAPARQ